MASKIFEDILAAALRVDGRAPTQAAIIKEATNRKGIDLESTISMRADEDLSDEDMASFEKGVDQYVDDLMEGLVRRNLDSILNSNERKGRKSKIKVSTVYGLRDKSGKAMSALTLTRLLNLVLYKYAQELMGSDGRLVNRTGRLAHSGIVTEVSQPSTGTVSVFFKYMLYPYEVFEPGGKMGSEARSPEKLFTQATKNALADILLSPISSKQIIRWTR